MKILCPVDQISCLKAGIDCKEDRIVLDIDPQALSAEERQWLASVLQKQDSEGHSILYFPYALNNPSFEGFKEKIREEMASNKEKTSEEMLHWESPSSNPKERSTNQKPEQRPQNTSELKDAAKAAGFMGLGALGLAALENLFGFGRPRENINIILPPETALPKEAPSTDLADEQEITDNQTDNSEDLSVDTTIPGDDFEDDGFSDDSWTV
ncbi:hypothetical protein A946_05440 [Methylacidiphilum kamchatkense Kam1]|uniref:Uncharacterized protein n=1 Tax=Methylacidiphilum kamchatkense Kam1 TaxID=1202785 RepID=A0A0C1URD6_9BACT|nr:hypothetical protein [Methylacidiphilum kamchatkense]KIE58849.1 hypothetical protein A946_05440 [Methylacidiphilum kamchatkense Kam1]QDQ41728.1 hypothetical protein kam1_477 [Methylacidiphilum kamchatkense Kam1]